MGIDMATTDGGDAGDAIAWSMQPYSLTRPTEISTMIKFGAALQLPPVDVGPAVERGKTYTKEKLYLQAYDEKTPSPFWELYETEHAELRTMQRLLLVVRRPVKTTVQGGASLQAKVRRKKFGLIPTNARVGDQGALKFTLS